MIQIEFDGNRFGLYEIKEFLANSEGDYYSGVHLYGEYGLDLLKDLYIVQNRRSAVSVSLLFAPKDIDNVLRHINIFATFSFTLVPTEVTAEVYKRIYDFFVHSPLSVTYITWITSLLMKPSQMLRTIRVDNVRTECPECECYLKHRNCSKGLIFHQLYHPLRGFPSVEDVALMCRIQQRFSAQIAKDLLAAAETDLEVFQATRKSLGIGRQYWVDPFNIYQGLRERKGIASK